MLKSSIVSMTEDQKLNSHFKYSFRKTSEGKIEERLGKKFQCYYLNKV